MRGQHAGGVFAHRHAGVSYEVLRDSVLARMKDAGHRPAGMAKVLDAILEDEFYLVTENYLFDLDVTVWGWIHLILGVAVALTGAALLARKAWAGAVAIVLAMLSALANFFVIPYYPWWALLMIGLAVWVVWSLTRPGALQLRD